MTDTETAEMVVQAARDFARRRIAPHALDWDRDEHFPVAVIREACALGMGAAYVSEDVDGVGLRRLDGVRIFEELAAGCPAIAAYLSIHTMCTWMVDAFGTEEQRRQWAPRMASGEWLASYCLTEPGAGSDAAALATRAVRDGDDYVLTGTKQFISGAGTSDVYVVMARTGGAGPRGISAFLVERDAPGLDFGAEERKMGWHAQPTRQVLLEGVRVPAANLLGGEEGTGFGIAMKGLNGGRLNIAACSLGGARAAAAAATRHVRDREAFGAPLVEEPTIRFALADMATALEASRALLWRAAEALDDGAEDAAEKCAMAKRFVTDECFGVADRALQLFGGYGYLAEYGVEKLVRDLRVHRILEGTNEIMRVVAGRSVATRGIGV